MQNDVESWLKQLGLSQYESIFIEHKIDLDILGELTDLDLRELGIALGDRKRMLRAIRSHSSQDQSDHVEAERRQLTIMFCDLVGSTDLSVRLDAEELRLVIGDFQRCCEQVVSNFGGRVARYMGDGLLVYFGYPAADEHDPERAVRTGLEICAAVGQLKSGTDIVLKTRVGIATGDVVVGDLIGEGASQEHAVVGETPNLAARLQGLAEPDTVVVSQATRRLVGALFQYHDLGPQQLKGFSKAVPAWRVVSEMAIESRFDASRDGDELPPLLGRDNEIATLMRHWTQVRNGTGQSSIVIGEAGIGKSHVVATLRSNVEQKNHRLLRYFCVPHQQRSALYPVIAQLERLSGINRSDDRALKLHKIEMMIAAFSSNAQELVPLYANFMEVTTGKRYKPMNLSPRLKKERMLEALIAQLSSFAREQPVLLLFEDLHWVDPTTLEFIQLLIERLDELPLFLLTTSRPEFKVPWEISDNATAIHLDRLQDSDVYKLINHVTQGKRLPKEVTDQILNKTDGVPLFVEEMTKSLLESGVLEEQSEEYVLKGTLPAHAVPSTLQDSLMARLDRLGAGKKLAQIGAAIGRKFSHELVAKVSSLDEQKLNQALNGLTRSGLVNRIGAPPQLDYLFKHALIQDAAYSTLLKDKKRMLHSTIADTLQLYYPQIGKQQPDVLAHHYTRAEQFENAIKFLERSARKSVDRASFEEAQKHIAAALDMLAKLPDDETRMQLELNLQVIRGVALESTLGYGASEVESTYDRAREICQQLDQKTQLVPVLLGLCVFNLVRGEYQRSQALATRCVALSKESNRLDYLIESCAALGYTQAHLGDLETSIKTFNDCISLYESYSDEEEFPNITAQDPCALAHSFVAIILWLTGDIEHSELAMERAFKLADKLGRPMNYAIAHTHAAEYYHMRREYDRALEHAYKGIQYAADNGYDSWHLCSLMHVGITLSTVNAHTEGIEMARQGLSQLGLAGAQINAAYFKSRTAWSLHVAGQHKDAQALLTEAFEDCKRSKDYLQACMLYQIQGEMALSGPYQDAQAAQSGFEKALEIAKEQGARIPQLRATMSLMALGTEPDKVKQQAEELSKLVQWFPDNIDVPDLVDAREVLNKTYQQSEIGA